VLAKDDPGITKDVAFALSITDVKYAQSFTGSNLVSSSDSWLRTSHGPEAFDTWRANGSLWYGTYDDTNIGYRPAVWVQLP
ncbi:MAG: hypothetical protein LBU61_01360, partial [Coriobacteriales bacterium]|nr:hypothetical protein [Coriobacteriales bacterium]